MIEHIFTDAGRAGIIEFDGRQQRRVSKIFYANYKRTIERGMKIWSTSEMAVC